MRKEDKIRELELFSGCGTDEARWVARNADEVEVAAGETLAVAGTKVREFFVVLDGVLGSDGGSMFTRPAHFGEIGLISGGCHVESIHALTTCRVLVFDARGFNGLLARVPAVARKLMRELVERVAAA